jgi:hypothetical protein
MMLTPPQLVDEEPKIIASFRRGETVARYETVRRRKDGTHIDVSLTISPILDETGSITELRKLPATLPIENGPKRPYAD